MRIAVSAGHNVYVGKYFDPGAVCNPYVEADINKETVALLIPLLKSQGHTVVDVTPYGGQFKDRKAHHVFRCKRVDEFNADIYIDVHINAGGGEGVEVWVHSMNSKSVPYANKIVENISKDTGLKNRGVKAKSTYWSVSLTSKPAMIVEGAFIDNKSDMEKLTPLKYATAIAKCFGTVKNEIKEEVADMEEKLNTIKIILHGKEIDIEGIYQNKTNYIPVRFLEKLGYSVVGQASTIQVEYKGEDK
ncbi:N-acetylmuramoyl-L-alanine amidase [Tissierella praeacuta]|uniref:N-acetylmuramoyl-L-alanine amidase n=1 Tax=Tissierella praeacuta TaxID=43131 RepID=UPI0028AB43F0|nr:N-acetylmuramoyl-L-alanine amidase [Tissierella praeacuta]